MGDVVPQEVPFHLGRHGTVDPEVPNPAFTRELIERRLAQEHRVGVDDEHCPSIDPGGPRDLHELLGHPAADRAATAAAD